MSQRNATPAVVVEWSPTQVSWVDAGHQIRTATSLEEAAPLLPGREVTIAVSRRNAFIRATRVPNASKPDVHRILQMQIGQIFPVAASDLSFDFHLTPDTNSEGRLAVIAAVRSTDIRALQAQAKSAGLRINRIVPSGFGSPILAKTLGLENGAVVHRTAEGLAIDLVAAGELRYSRLAAMPTSAVGIDAEVSRTFAAAILPCSPTIAAGALALADAEASTDSWAIEALSGAHLDINIRTPEEIAAVEQRREAGKLRVGIVLFGIAASFLAWQALRFNAASSIVAAETTKQNKAKSDLQKHADAVAAKTKKSTTMQDTLKLAFHPAQSISDVLTLAMNTAPKDIWLTAISLDRGKALTVRGISKGANSPSNYEAQMQGLADGDLKRFRDVKMAFQTNAEVDKTPVVQFSLSGFPVGNLPLADLTGKVVKQ